MKTIVDVLEKLSVDDIHIDDINFPIDAPLKDICEYLRHQGFTELPSGGSKLKMYLAMNKKKGKVFIYFSDWFIRFADTSNHKIDKDHPVYAIFDDNRYYIEWINSFKKDDYSLIPKEEFLKLLNDKFEWK